MKNSNHKNGKDKTKNKKGKSEDALKKRVSRIIIGATLILFVITAAGLSVFTYKQLCKSDYFFVKTSLIDWVREPLAREPYKGLMSTGTGKNIFEFDITSAAKTMRDNYPEFKDVRIIRDFPNRLTLRIDPRVPVAQVGESSFFLVDEEGVVLTGTQDLMREDLPLVTGVGWRLFRDIGMREDTPRMTRALELLDAIKASDFGRDYTLMKIDVSDYKNISFFVTGGLEVKIGSSNFSERLDYAYNTLAGAPSYNDEIEYIDLRFDDVVLGTK